MPMPARYLVPFHPKHQPHFFTDERNRTHPDGYRISALGPPRLKALVRSPSDGKAVAPGQPAARGYSGGAGGGEAARDLLLGMARERLARAESRGGYRRVEADLDLTGLDTNTTNLQLMIDPPQELDGFIGPPAAHVSRSVQATTVPTERIGHEALCRQRRSAVVPAREAVATDVQLPGNADGNRLEPMVQQVELLAAASDSAHRLGALGVGIQSLARDAVEAADVADLGSTYARFADVFRSGKPLGAETSLLKIWATETFCRLVDLLIEVAGDSGGLRGEIELGRQKVDVLSPFYIGFVATIAAGSNEIQRNILAKRVLRLPS
mgnify:CR=1 FL=1